MTTINEQEWNIEYFKKELTKLINKHSIDNKVNIPDYLISDYLVKSIEQLTSMQRLIDYNFPKPNIQILTKKE